MKKLALPLSARIFLFLLLGVGFFGTINLFLFDSLVRRGLEDALIQRGSAVALSAASRGVQPLLRGDELGLATLDKAIREEYGEVLYLVYYDPAGRPAGGSFGTSPPPFLLTGPLWTEGGPRRYRAGNDRFLDFSSPMTDGKVGWVRLGVSESGIRRRVSQGKRVLLGMIAFFLLAGVGGAILVAGDLRRGARILVSGTEEFSFDRPPPRLPVERTDELGSVARSVSRMMVRLQQLHQDHLSLLAKFRDSDRLSSVGLLASGLAHDINNPLSGLIASLQRIAKNPCDQRQLDAYLGPMLDAATHIRDVLANLMAFIRRRRYEPVLTGIEDALDKLRTLASHRFGSDVSLEVDLHSGLPPVYFDPTCLLQVLVNVVFNAADALEEAGGTIRISAAVNNDTVSLLIRDDGPGMSPEILGRAFDPLFSTKPEGRGTGLGLPLSRQMVQDHGGALTLQSSPGKGTTVRIDLKRTDS